MTADPRGALRQAWARVRRLIGRSSFEHEMDAEMEHHLDLEIAERIRSGMTPAEARRTALRDFGGVTRQKEAARAVRGLPWVSDLGSDLKVALRQLRRAPSSSAAAIVTLALGVGAATATVSVVNGVLLTSMPYPAADRMVVAWETNRTRQRWANSVAVANFEAWTKRTQAFQSLAALVPDQQVLDRGQPDRIRGVAVSPAWFDVVGVHPEVGRGFTDEEGRAGSAVVVLSDDFWRTVFGADPGLIGQPIQFRDRRLTVVGVMPRGFQPPSFGWVGPEQRYWVPFMPNDDTRRWGRSLLVLGRIRPNLTIADGERDLARMMEERGREDPESNKDWSATAKGLRDEVVGASRTPLLVLLVAVLGLLGTTTVNVMAIMLARMKRQESELALRLALGAGRGRLTRQLVAEATALVLVAAPLGGALAWLAIKGLAVSHPSNLPRVENVTMDGAMAGVAVGLSFLAALVALLVPVWRLGRLGLRGFIEAGSGRTTRRPLGGRLVVAEVAVALVLTIGAGLAMRSFVALESTPLGFDASRTTAFRVSLPSERYDDAATRSFFAELASRLRQNPAVEKVGLVSVRPLGGVRVATTVFPSDRPMDKRDAPVAEVRAASAGYFETLSVPLATGRYPEPTARDAERPIVVTRALVDQLWPGDSGIGRRIRINLNNGIEARIAAVVPNLRIHGPAVEPRAAVFFPFETAPEGEMDVLVKARRDGEAIGSIARAAVGSLDPSLPIYDVESIGGLVDDAMASERVTFLVLTSFSIVAVLLAAVGVAGVLLVEVGQRRRELGVRMALGAQARTLRGSVVRAGLELAGAGVAIGLLGAWGLTRFMRGLLHGVSPADPLTFGMVAAALLVVALAATFVPAYRVTRVDPLEVLRSD